MGANDELERLSEQHARELSALLDETGDACEERYKAADDARDDDDREAKIVALGLGLSRLIHAGRGSARYLAAGHIVAELRAATGRSGTPSIDLGPQPDPKDVQPYVNNALDAARQAAMAGAMVSSTSWWARRIVDSELVSTHNASRRAAEGSLKREGKNPERAGFGVADSTGTTAQPVSAKPSASAVPLLAKRWDATIDSHTCAVCRGMNGRLAPLDQSFPEGDPPIHAMCRCVTALHIVGFTETLNAMADPTGTTPDPSFVRLGCEIETRAIDAEARIVRDAVASDESLDAHGSVIKASGWDLARFNRNPVLLWSHATHGMMNCAPEDVLGTVKARVDGKKLLVDLHFPPAGANPKADMVFGQIQRKEVRGLSVGFKHKKYHFENEGGDHERLVIDEAELIEVSVVPIPSNPNTLIREFKASMPAPAEKATQPVAPQQEIRSMSEPTVVRESVSTLPAKLAAVLSVDDVDGAVREISKLQLQIGSLNLELEKANKRADDAHTKLTEYRQRAAEEAVDALIKDGRLAEDRRATAVRFGIEDLAGLQAMFPARAASAPRAELLKPIVGADPGGNASKPARGVDFYVKRARELQKEGLSYEEAYSRALNEATAGK